MAGLSGTGWVIHTPVSCPHISWVSLPLEAGPHSVLMAAKDELGRLGEDIAAAWLTDRGIKVLVRNWRCPEGELDIVATDDEYVIFCEVKTRSGDLFGSPFEAVTQGKRRKIRRLAQLCVADLPIRGFPPFRFDVIGVMCRPGQLPTVEHRPRAF